MTRRRSRVDGAGRPADDTREPASRLALLLVLFFASGFAGLVYEVLWMKELGLLFGNSSHAAAATLAAFFLGLVAGARFWGRRAGTVAKPLRTFALLEAGVAGSAALYFVLLDAYHAVYSPLFQLFGDHRLPFLVVKLGLAIGILFPPSFFMGGTLPIMSQHLIRRRDGLGRVGSVLYAVNTLGAAAGAYAAGFHLPRLLGFDRSYLAGMIVTGAVALVAWTMGGERRETSGWDEADRPERISEDRPTRTPWSPGLIRILAVFSGFATLGLEVLWTRMFAQVLQNSVYTFSAILVTFLLALAIGSGIASWLIRKGPEPGTVLPSLLVLSGLLVAASPFVFVWLTGGLGYFGGQRSFGAYIGATFLCAFGVMLLPAVCLGVLFPYLLRLAEPFSRGPGRTVGDLASVNTLGAVAGSLVAGFVFLDLFGLWASIRLLAVAYLCASLLVTAGLGKKHRGWQLAAVAGLFLVVTALDPARLPIVDVDPVEKGESVLRVWEGSSGIVSVIRQPSSLAIKLDNDYSLGGTGAVKYEEAQTHLPLWIHPEPRSVFFLGMGTGITAGAALLHPVDRVVVSELSPDVVEAARTFFEPYVHGLFEDDRATVVAEDGRNVLLGTDETFDVIVADLFMTWRAGVGSLFSREHYRAARDRLRPGGLYAQWLPLYQASRDELFVVARTMTEVFPLVTFWRGAIAPGWETAVLVGHERDEPLDRRGVIRRLERSGDVVVDPRDETGDEGDPRPPGFSLRDLVVQYAGNLTAARELFSECPANTDDRPVIEYQAPVTHRRIRAAQGSWLVGGELVRFLADVLLAVPPEADPYLEELAPAEVHLVRGGLGLYASQVLDRAGEKGAALKALREFQHLYAAAGGDPPPVAESDESRREIEDLIATYEERIRGLRRHLDDEETVDGSPSEATASPPTSNRAPADG